MPSPLTISVPADRNAECVTLLATWEAADPWDAAAVARLTTQLLALFTEITKPRILHVRGGEATAKLLRGVMGSAANSGPQP
jgi:hypothetical protein